MPVIGGDDAEAKLTVSEQCFAVSLTMCPSVSVQGYAMRNSDHC
jgi:hypothetical protein